MRAVTVKERGMFNMKTLKAAALACLCAALGACSLTVEDEPEVTLYAGRPLEAGFADGAALEAARFSSPYALVLDSSGVLYVGDAGNHRIRKITPQGEVTTLAGSGTNGFADGTGTAAAFSEVRGLALYGDFLYAADHHNHRVRKIKISTGEVTTLAGSGEAGFADGAGAAAAFNYPQGIAADGAGNVYVADIYNSRIRKISPDGTVTTLAGKVKGFAEGSGQSASFSEPAGVAADSAGTVYVADTWNHCIRAVTPEGEVSVYGSYRGSWGYLDGESANAKVGTPGTLAIGRFGNLYFTDGSIPVIRKLSVGYTVSAPVLPGDPYGQAMPDKTVGRIISTLAGARAWNGERGYREGSGSYARFNDPKGLAVDERRGYVYVADTGSHVIRRIKLR
jgi:DNA-binding beta-propeller fold protein YncE